MNYDKVWEVMNNLEESFNRIVPLEQMIDDLQEAVDNGDSKSVMYLSKAMKSYMPVFMSQYDKASRRAWNNTVGEVRKEDEPYRDYYQNLTNNLDKVCEEDIIGLDAL
tara:strand:+ start:1339 stop:1662 length:324 start_codon:yes stop_codon:yes gene_type:complete